MAKRAFTLGEVRDIRSRKSTPQDLAKYYGVGVETIRRVLRYETYGQVPDLQERPEEAIRASAERLLTLQQAITPTDLSTIPVKEMTPEELAKAKLFGLLGEIK